MNKICQIEIPKQIERLEKLTKVKWLPRSQQRFILSGWFEVSVDYEEIVNKTDEEVLQFIVNRLKKSIDIN